ncbi:MAG: 1,4-beta-D-glucan glucohydrolase, partial [Gammaproteobacteria bacterium]|nr:1,4-beta-D-glucan glucohydrolase [Gammaproteobacteria bacterium]
SGYGLDYRSRSTPGKLPEDASIPPHFRAARGSLFFAGHPTAPWSMFVADGDAEVHVTTVRQASPQGAVTVTLAAAGAVASWNGSRDGMLRISGRATDLRPQASAQTSIDVRYRVDRPPDRPVYLGMRCTESFCGTRRGAMLDVSGIFRTAPVGVWKTLVIPVSCVNATGADLASVEVPFAVETAGKFGVTLAEVRLAANPAGARTPCPRSAAR